MKLPIRNGTSKPLNLFIEVHCDAYEIPVGGEAVVTLEDDHPHAIELLDNQITIWNEGEEQAEVRIINPVA